MEKSTKQTAHSPSNEETPTPRDDIKTKDPKPILSTNDSGYFSSPSTPITSTPNTPPSTRSDPSLSPLFTTTHIQNPTPTPTQPLSKSLTTFLSTTTGLEAGQIQARYLSLKHLTHHYKTNNTTPKLAFNIYKTAENLNTGNSDALALTTSLFTSHGILKREFKDKLRGDVEREGMLILQYLCIEKPFRRKGLGSFLLHQMVVFARERTRGKGGVGVVFVKPCAVEEDFQDEVVGMSREEREGVRRGHWERAVGFYRRVGFWEVGGSGWFVLELDGR